MLLLSTGGSCGAAVSTAMLAAKDLKEGQRCVVILPDGLRNYMTKFLSDQWMMERDLLDASNDVSQKHWYPSSLPIIIFPKKKKRKKKWKIMNYLFWNRWSDLKVSTLGVEAPLSITPSVSCQEAIDIMKKEGFDQLPVAEADGYLTIASMNLTIRP